MSINEKLKQLCEAQSRFDTDKWERRDAERKIKVAMDAEFKPLQRSWRRMMKKAAGKHGFFMSAPIVWALIDHSKRPVSVIPIATAEIHLKGIKLEISCRADPAEMEAMADRAARAFAILEEES